MRIGVVVGLRAEARVARRLGWDVAVGGGSADGAMAAAQRLVAAGATGLVSFGLAGGLDPDMRPGDLIVASAVTVAGASYPTDVALSLQLGGATGHAVLCPDAVVATTDAKRGLHGLTGAAAIDLESGAVARVAVAGGLPFAVLRSICDPADQPLPPAALIALSATGGVVLRGVAASLLGEPRQLADLLALARHAMAARRALTARVSQIVRARPSIR